MLLLVVSDLHLGKGRYLSNGQLNILEDFDEDEKFVEFLDFYSTDKYENEEVHLVLNGDILNLIQIDVEGVFTHFWTEEHTLKAVKSIINGHPDFFKSLKDFLKKPNKKITYIFGNHDFAMVWPAAQELLKRVIGAALVFEEQIITHGVLVEHGHRFEKINSVPKNKYFVDGPNGVKILNLPWGSLFCLYMMPLLKKERPYIDKVRPLSVYVRWCFLHDFRFFVTTLFTTMKYLFKTRFAPYTRYNKNFKTNWKVLAKLSVHPKYEKFAKRIFLRRSDINVVIMGHTHVAEWRRFPEGKIYFNTGTWNPVPSMDIGLHKNISKLTYACIEISPEKGLATNAFLNVWQGKWRPYREEVSTTT
ncbi:MAG: metallophosphoesterase [Bacteriovoracaceae bacterium]|nr:metallophosphoesterase [Bacteriovoracaceae bacterium]